MHKEYGRTFWQHLQVAYVSNSGIFYQHWLLNCIYNARFWVPSQDRKGSAMLYGETSIAAEVVHDLPIMHEEVERRFWTYIYIYISPLLSTPCHFCYNWLSYFTQNATFGVPYHHRKWNAVLQWEIYVAAEVLHNLPKMYKEGQRSLWQHP